jgi:hypothetical protein
MLSNSLAFAAQSPRCCRTTNNRRGAVADEAGADRDFRSEMPGCSRRPEGVHALITALLVASLLHSNCIPRQAHPRGQSKPRDISFAAAFLGHSPGVMWPGYVPDSPRTTPRGEPIVGPVSVTEPAPVTLLVLAFAVLLAAHPALRSAARASGGSLRIAPARGLNAAETRVARGEGPARAAGSRGIPAGSAAAYRRPRHGLSAEPPRTSCSPSLLLSPPVNTYASKPRSTRI